LIRTSFDALANREFGSVFSFRGTTFARVEDAIDAAEFSRDHKAALWLLAWSLRDRENELRDARLDGRRVRLRRALIRPAA
jgi:hypothetical protein